MSPDLEHRTKFFPPSCVEVQPQAEEALVRCIWKQFLHWHLTKVLFNQVVVREAYWKLTSAPLSGQCPLLRRAAGAAAARSCPLIPTVSEHAGPPASIFLPILTAGVLFACCMRKTGNARKLTLPGGSLQQQTDGSWGTNIPAPWLRGWPNTGVCSAPAPRAPLAHHGNWLHNGPAVFFTS